MYTINNIIMGMQSLLMCIEITGGITIAKQQCLQVSLRHSYLFY